MCSSRGFVLPEGKGFCFCFPVSFFKLKKVSGVKAHVPIVANL